jgi:hypothetical protein
MTRAERMRIEIAGENASALELLLTDKIVTRSPLSELHESLTTAQLSRDNIDRPPCTRFLHPQMVTTPADGQVAREREPSFLGGHPGACQGA